MPAEDPINPEANAWMEKDKSLGPARRSVTAPVKLGRDQAGQILRLAARLGLDPEQLAAKIPPDTLRRLKYPVMEHVEPDGSRSFKEDRGIIPDRRALIEP